MCTFVDLGQAFNREPHSVILWSPRKPGVDEWPLKVVQAMYMGAVCRVRVSHGYKDGFIV